MAGTMYVFFGLIASGKSSLGEAVARRLGFSYHNSDRVRKELAGSNADHGRGAAVDQGIYTPAFSRLTYDALLQRAEEDIGGGIPGVVLDASYQQRGERQRVRDLAERLGCRVLFFLCRCPEREMRRRMEQRARDPKAVSDGRWEIYLAQRERFEPPTELEPEELLTIETILPVEELTDVLLSRLAGGRSTTSF